MNIMEGGSFMKKKLFPIVLLFLITILVFPATVKAEEFQKIVLCEQFKITNPSDGTVLEGIVTINEPTLFENESDIKHSYNGKFTGTVTFIKSDGTSFTEDYEENIPIALKQYAPKYGINDATLCVSPFIKKDLQYYSSNFLLLTTIDIQDPTPDTDAIKTVTAQINNPSMMLAKNSTSTTTDRINWYVDSIYRETEELDDEDGEPIKVKYTKDLEQWVINNVTLTGPDGEQLSPWIVTFSKNVTNLKYGTKNGTVKIEVSVPGYSLISVPITISYFPELEVKDVTRTKIELEPINGAEYSIDGVNWQKSSKFTKLKKDTQYTISVRQKGDTAGTSITTIKVTTEAE